ncbi:hypothetical protein DL96DRAFT_886525 [Flagelloscypha sp. PMI_526]|nr:hypothetical protein DL96DRAFT_886525 [Flagelloscypha sp. PMI_526]
MAHTTVLSSDVLQLIIDIAASSSISAALVFSLVSHEVQSWADLFIFNCFTHRENAHNRNPSRWDTKRILEVLCSPHASPRLIRARSHVRTIVWQPRMDSRVLIQEWLSTFPNLNQLCVWNSLFPLFPSTGQEDFDFNQVYPSLKRISPFH